MLPAECIEAIRRNAWKDSVKITLEIERHRTECPGYLEDKDYTQYLSTKLADYTEIYNACHAALEFKQFIPERSQQ